MTVVEEHRPGSGSFQHEAFLYDSDEAYVDTLAPLLADAVGAGDQVLLVVPARQAALLRGALDALEPAEGTVETVDADEWYRQPVATIAAYEAKLSSLPAGTRAFVVGEVQFGSTPEEWSGWTRYEAALNRVLAHHGARVICPYDRRSLAPAICDGAELTHPYVLTPHGPTRSALYTHPAEVAAMVGPTVTIPHRAPDVDVHVEGDPRPARRAFAAAAGSLGLSRERVDELTVAVNEVVTNALVHGGGAARVRVWVGPDDLVCAVDDEGPGIPDPLVGYARPPHGSVHGYGAWLARRLFDRCEVLPRRPRGSTVVLAAGG